jgi:NTP pyrophosphatase (non-canonical NTP hydrolase)
MKDVAEEIADVLIYLLRLADVLGIELDRAVDEKMAENESKYPVDESRGTATKYDRR